MRSYIANLPLTAWAVLGIPALIVARCLVTDVLPCVAHAIVPQVVRTVLSVI
jgi:hypothetical protein